MVNLLFVNLVEIFKEYVIIKENMEVGKWVFV